MKNGWFRACANSRVRIFWDNDQAVCIATNFGDLDRAQNIASDEIGKDLVLDTWFCPKDSPHLGLLEGEKWWDEGWSLAGLF